MTKIHDRSLWNAPAISLSFGTPKYEVVCMTMCPCDSYVKKAREGWSGRFRQGTGKYWLPGVFCGIFVLVKHGGRLTVEYQEVIDWQFDWELTKSGLKDFIVERALSCAKFASFLGKG
jgi:hypothetical protein